MFDLSTMGKAWDVLIIGAGPAGSAAAITCVRQGLKVAMVDAKPFPRRKVCGGCLNQVSGQLLRGLIGGHHPLWLSAGTLDGFALMHRGQRFSFSMPEGFAVDRAMMDQSLVEVAQSAGVEFLAGVTAKLGEVANERRQVRLTNANGTLQVAAKVVVLACGLGNRSASDQPELQQVAQRNSRIGIEAIYTQFPSAYTASAIHMVVARTGYVGLTQIVGGRLHVAAAVDRQSLQALGPEQLITEILSEAGAPALPCEAVVWRGTPPLTARAQHLSAERTFLVGDAAGYIEPFTGEGIRWALETGSGVAELVGRGCDDWQDSLSQQWEHWYHRKIAPEQRLCRQITSGLKHPGLRWFAHQAIRLYPGFATSIISRLNTA